MSNSGKIRPFIVTATATLLLTAFLTAVTSAQEINIRTSNLAQRMERVLTPLFLDGYFQLEQSLTIKKGGGFLMSDADVFRVYFPKTKAEYDAMKASNKIVETDFNKFEIHVCIYETPADAKKNVPIKDMKAGSFSGAIIGEGTWTSSAPRKTLESVREEERLKAEEEAKKNPKPTPSPSPTLTKPLSPSELKAKAEEEKKQKEEQEKKDKELTEKLAKDPNNFYSKTLIAVKHYGLVYVKAINYTKEPDAALMEDIARRLAEQLL